jgi:hypothetical protein
MREDRKSEVKKLTDDVPVVPVAKIVHSCGKFLTDMTFVGGVLVEYDGRVAVSRLAASRAHRIPDPFPDRVAELGMVTSSSRRAVTNAEARPDLGLPPPRRQGARSNKTVKNKELLPERCRRNDAWSWLCPRCGQWTSVVTDHQLSSRVRRVWGDRTPKVPIH